MRADLEAQAPFGVLLCMRMPTSALSSSSDQKSPPSVMSNGLFLYRAREKGYCACGHVGCMYSVGLLHPWCVRNMAHRNAQDLTAFSHLTSRSCTTHPSSGSQLCYLWPVLSVCSWESNLQRDGQYMTQNVWGIHRIPQNSLDFLSCLVLKTLS